MLLSYVANAADIFDLFTSLQAPELVHHKDVTYGILAIYTWSLLQFALVATVVYKRKSRKRRRKKEKDDLSSVDSKKKKSSKENVALKEKAIEDKLRKKRNREKEEFLDKKYTN